MTMPGYEDYASGANGGFNDLIGEFASSLENQRNPGSEFMIIPEDLEASEVGVDRPVVTETEPEVEETKPDEGVSVVQEENGETETSSTVSRQEDANEVQEIVTVTFEN